MDDEVITQALGVESAYGYHIEQAPPPPFVVPVQERPPAPWYPCIDTDGRYSGCLGEACPIEVCWTGTPTISYAIALCRRFQPTSAEYAPGALCAQCSHVQEVTVAVVDQRRGLVHLPMLHCTQQRWIHPISVAAFVRKRIPAQEDTNLAACPRFTAIDRQRPAVEQHRLLINRQARERRSGATREHHG